MLIPFNIKDDTIYLIADGSNYALATARERNRNGVVTTEYESFKWFPTINTALTRIIDLKVKRSDATTLIELRKDIEAAHAEVMAAWKVAA